MLYCGLGPSCLLHALAARGNGRHFAFVKVLPPRNYEIYLGDLESDRQVRLTYSDSFGGFPAISPDGRWLLFSSSRDSEVGTRQMTQYLMDISRLGRTRGSAFHSSRSELTTDATNDISVAISVMSI